MKRILLVLSLLLAACGYPPSAEYVTDPKAPASKSSYDLEVTANTATALIFIAYDSSKFSGETPADDVRSLDESIVRVVRSTSDHTVQSGGPTERGRAFVLYGVRPGKTELEVFLDGESNGVLPITVLAQDR
jgi:hypothetical protein